MAQSENRNEIGKITEYYENNQIMYTLFWSRSALHLGLWDEQTKNLADAVQNTTRVVCRELDISAHDRVLDAGCGVGGSSIYIAKHTGAEVTGITLSEKQIRIASRHATEAGVSERTRFRHQDYSNTSFEDGSFTRIFGIESICHANPRVSFFREAHRLLQVGGKIAVVDAFLGQPESALTEKQRYQYRKFLDGWVLPSLATVEELRKDMVNAGFRNVEYHNKKENVRRSSNIIHLLGVLGYPLTWLGSTLGLVPKNMHGNTLASIYQKRLADQDLVTYGIFLAEK